MKSPAHRVFYFVTFSKFSDIYKTNQKLKMKKILTFALMFLGITVFSQDINKMLQANKWYVKSAGKKIVYSKKQDSKNQETVEFKEDGKITQCALTTETSLDASGKEITSPETFKCNTIQSYEVKNGMLKTQLLKQTPYYYKLAMTGETIELTPIKAEEFK